MIITNGHPEVQRAKLSACSCEVRFCRSPTLPMPRTSHLCGRCGSARQDLFPIILVGGEQELLGCREKPSPDIFEAACRLVGCAPAEALHVGDSLATDIQARAMKRSCRRAAPQTHEGKSIAARRAR